MEWWTATSPARGSCRRWQVQLEGDDRQGRPPGDPFNITQFVDTRGGCDTIDQLVRHAPESNSKVGMIGSTYDGWTVVSAETLRGPAAKSLLRDHTVLDHADALDLAAHQVAWLEEPGRAHGGANALRRSRGDKVAGLQGERRREVFDLLIDVVDHLRGV
jgi:hypothetical protein